MAELNPETDFCPIVTSTSVISKSKLHKIYRCETVSTFGLAQLIVQGYGFEKIIKMARVLFLRTSIKGQRADEPIQFGFKIFTPGRTPGVFKNCFLVVPDVYNVVL